MSDRPRYREALLRLMKRDQRVQLKKMSKGGSIHRAYQVTDVWTTRASGKLRVILVPEGKDYQLVGFRPKGDHTVFGAEA